MDNNDPNYPNQPQHPPEPQAEEQAPGAFGAQGASMPPAQSYVPRSYPQEEVPAVGAPPPSYQMQEPAPIMVQPPYPGPEAAPKKRGKAGLIVGVVALVVLLAAGAVGTTFLGKLANRPSVAVETLLPANTLAFLKVDTAATGKQKEALDKLRAVFESQPGFKEAWAKMADQAMKDGGSTSGDATPAVSDFDSLSQYLGNNAAIAVLPPSSGDLQELKDSFGMEGKGGEAMLRYMAGVVDLDFNPLNKKGPISELKKQVDNFANAPLEEKYREIEIHKYITGTNTIYFSLLNGTATVLVGGKVEPLRVLIDQYTDKKGLSEDARFKNLASQVPSDNLASLYVNLTEITTMAALADPEMAAAAPKTDGAALVTVSAQDDGMQIDVASEATMAGADVKLNANAHPDAKTLADIPSGSVGFLAGADLKDMVQAGLDAMRKQSQASGGEDMVQSTLDEMEQSTGLNLEKDILPWMGGDYALSASVDTQSGMPLPGVVFQLKLNPADHDKAASTLDKLVQSMSGGSEQKLDIPEGTFYAPSPDAGAVFGVTGDRLLIVTGEDADGATAAAKSVLAGLGKGVGTTSQWQNASKHLPKDSNAIVYLDLGGIRGAVEGMMPPDGKTEYEQGVAPLVRPFKYITIGEAGSGSNISLTKGHAVIFLGIGK
ncbi:MAG: DUF3352 domain-containing protein [Chloroflexia bacterium]